MRAKLQRGLRVEKLGFLSDESATAFTERAVPFEQRAVSTANLHRAVWWLQLQHALQAEIRGPVTPQKRKAAESPLRFAFGCFPGFRARGGEAEDDPKDPSDSLICLKKIGAGEGIRTLDPDLGKVVLYP